MDTSENKSMLWNLIVKTEAFKTSKCPLKDLEEKLNDVVKTIDQHHGTLTEKNKKVLEIIVKNLTNANSFHSLVEANRDSYAPKKPAEIDFTAIAPINPNVPSTIENPIYDMLKEIAATQHTLMEKIDRLSLQVQQSTLHPAPLE